MVDSFNQRKQDMLSKKDKSTIGGWDEKIVELCEKINSLENYYTTNFSLMQHHKYTLADLENMLPWEREIYVDMLVTYIKEENEKEKRRQQNQKG